jgi:hypothetical protein
MNQNTFCSKCYRIPSQCCCNTAPKELSDEEIKAIELQISEGVACYDDFDFVAFARAILKKASEK